jgi:hypothetical protein
MSASCLVDTPSSRHAIGSAAQYPEGSLLLEQRARLRKEKGSRWVPTRVALS